MYHFWQMRTKTLGHGQFFFLNTKFNSTHIQRGKNKYSIVGSMQFSIVWDTANYFSQKRHFFLKGEKMRPRALRIPLSQNWHFLFRLLKTSSAFGKQWNKNNLTSTLFNNRVVLWTFSRIISSQNDQKKGGGQGPWIQIWRVDRPPMGEGNVHF